MRGQHVSNLIKVLQSYKPFHKTNTGSTKQSAHNGRKCHFQCKEVCCKKVENFLSGNPPPQKKITKNEPSSASLDDIIR